MINELYGLAKALESEGIRAQKWCKDYKLLPNVTKKAPCIRVWLDDSGNITNFEEIDAKLAKEIRKYGNNQATFPGFNIHPLYRVTDGEEKEMLQKILDEKCDLDYETVFSWCTHDNWLEKNYEKIERCLVKKPQELLQKIVDAGRTEENIIKKLGEVTAQLSAKVFRTTLETCILKKLRLKEDYSLCLYLLLFGGNGVLPHTADEGPSISIVLDLVEWKDYQYPVTNKHTTKWLNQCLLEAEKIELDNQENDGTDAFGQPFSNPGKPMPGIKLSGFEVTLRAMFKGQPCQFRYGQIDDASYPISEENRQSIKCALEWLGSPEQEGKTWQRGTNNEIIFAYPSSLPKVQPALVSIFGITTGKDSSQTRNRFGEAAEALIKTLEGIPNDEVPDSIQIFALQKMDKARTKVVFTNKTSPQELMVSAKEWQGGCQNIPRLELETEIPFPLQVSRVVNDIWKQNGELAQGKNKAERMKDYQGIDLLLGNMPKTILLHYLHIIITQSSGLVICLGQQLHGRVIGKKDKSLSIREESGALLFPVLGLLLMKNGIGKEKYMEEQAYLLGQLLHVADELHILYCRVVREGAVSPQLVGNSMFVTARETPNVAVSQISVRLNPYIVWAKQYRFKGIGKKDVESWRAGWYLSIFEKTANKLALSMTKTARFDDFEKAQLFIGYLASFPKKEETGEKNAEKADTETTIDKNGGKK